MSKLFSLLKATMSDGIQIFNYRAKTERAKRVVPILLAVFVAVMMFFSASSMMLGEDSNASAALSLYVIITTIVIIAEGIYKSGDLLFKPRDNDMLLAMPLKKSTIIFARIVKFYVFELLYCFIFLLPAIIAYAVNTSVEPSYYLVAATMIILVPVIPIAISCLAGLIISALSAKSKHKSFWQIILSFIIMFAFAVLIMIYNTTPDSGGQMLISASNNIAAFYYPADVFIKLVTNFDIWQYLIFVGVNLAVMVVVVLLISKFYFKIVTWMSIIKRGKKIKADYKFTRFSQTSAMVRKEINRYFNTPVLLINTAMGLVVFAVAVGVLCFKYDDIVGSIMSSVENFPLTIDELRLFVPGVVFVMVAFASLMTFITTTMISLEGKTINMLKTMPISGKKVIMAKVLSAMLLIVPVTLIGSIAMFVRFQFNIVEILLILIAVVAMPLVTQLIGILIDLKYARFDAESDVVVVKQSAGVMISTFLGLGMVLITAGLTIAFTLFVGQILGLLILDVIFVIVASLLYLVIAVRSDKQYMRLMA